MAAGHAGRSGPPTKPLSGAPSYYAVLFLTLSASMLQGGWAGGDGIDKDKIIRSILSLRLTDLTPSHGSHLSVQAVGVLLILTGLLMTFVGKALGKALIALIGFFCLAVVGFLAMEHLHHARPELFKVGEKAAEHRL